MSKPQMVTEHAQFYRVTIEDGRTIYFAAEGVNARATAIAADHKGDPPIVGGFAVYNTNVSTDYAVALYSSKEEAEAHEPDGPAPAPRTVFEDDNTDADKSDALKQAEATTEVATPQNSAEPVTRKPEAKVAKPKAAKKRGITKRDL